LPSFQPFQASFQLPEIQKWEKITSGSENKVKGLDNNIKGLKNAAIGKNN
jgi:hypothetical protein